ncbi:family 43 glycosylhydrolase [Hymenobacter swuensis]|uniref:Glycoside hydrolase family protein n=1 Tax=Hymenobacter swuensis DY53 TaxID=1227739 RepID=W8F6P6_9BACT|nr:family 43 glycosylhydrolase [Hymenobacter swuensis]AHJ98296.1 glycoside hydrolase family protein [Hymenobacter swuensis DY53]
MQQNSLRTSVRRLSGPVLLSLGLLAACQRPVSTSTRPAEAGSTSSPAAAMAPAVIANPVLPGDFPDPSVVKVGDTYWATATSSNWGPTFPLLKSTDLVKWELVGHVFPGERPAWADYYFWAPEISEEGGKIYVYYTAHKRGGNLAVGVASASNPAGPYTDHGPLVGQPHGSIDGFPMRDENGQLYLIWKEDGNSVQQPTPIWAQRINEARTALVGEKQELFRNDPATWEGNLVEGVSIVRREGYFYAFYAANGCCGSGCTYATGVARAKTLLGPWEKYAKNPILINNDAWKCPGHGTAVQHQGRWFMLHHAYAANSQQFVGRQGVLTEFTWAATGWPEFRGGTTAVAPTPVSAVSFTDEYTSKTLAPSWQWPVEERPTFALRGGQLYLTARPDHTGAALGQSTTAPAYTATTTLLNPAALPAGSRAGLAAHGDPDNTLAVVAGGGKVQLLQTEKGQTKTLAETTLPAAKTLQLRLQAQQGSQFTFGWSTDGGATWQPLPAGGAAVNGSYLPPWDRGIRVGPLAHGPASAVAVFENFKLEPQQ